MAHADLDRPTRRRTPHGGRASLVERAAGRLGLPATPDTERAAHAAPAVGGPSRPPRPAASPERTAPPTTAAAAPAPLPAPPQAAQRVRLDRDGLRAAGLIDPDGGRGRLAEEFRMIKRPLLTRVRAADGDPRGRLIVVSSAQPGEGKTFVALNLALSLTQERGLFVLLVDADAAARGVARALGIPRDSPGLSDLLADARLDLAEAIRRTDLDNLAVLPPGLPHPQMTELLTSPRMERLGAELATRYRDRVVIIDGPPLLASSEAAVLGAQAGQVLLVVEADRTPRDRVDAALALLGERTGVALVLNKVSTGRDPNSYGAYESKAAARREEESPARGGTAPGGAPPTARTRWWRRWFALPLATALLAAGAPRDAPAAWIVTPRIELTVGYTDNVDLEPRGEEEEAVFGEVAPGVAVEARGARYRLAIDYSLRQLLYVEESERNELRHDLSAIGRVELVDRLLYVDGLARVEDVIIDTDEVAGGAGFGGESDRAAVGVFGVSPVLRRQIRDWVVLEARYSVTRVEVEGDELEDTTTQLGRTQVSGLAPIGGRLGWTATAEIEDTRGDGTETASARDARRWLAALDTRLALTPQVALLGGIGYGGLEDNTLADSDRAGIYWNAGVELRPGPRSSLRVTYGEVYEHSRLQIEAAYRLTRRIRVLAAYDEAFESRQSLLARRLTPGDDGGPGRPPDPVDDGAVTAARNETFFRRRLDAALEGTRGRVDYRLSAFRVERDFDLATPDEASVGVALSVVRRLNPRTQLALGAGYSRTEFDDDEGRRDDLVRLATSLSYDLSRTALITLGYDLGWRESNRADADQIENVVYVRVRKEF